MQERQVIKVRDDNVRKMAHKIASQMNLGDVVATYPVRNFESLEWQKVLLNFRQFDISSANLSAFRFRTDDGKEHTYVFPII